MRACMFRCYSNLFQIFRSSIQAWPRSPIASQKCCSNLEDVGETLIIHRDNRIFFARHMIETSRHYDKHHRCHSWDGATKWPDGTSIEFKYMQGFLMPYPKSFRTGEVLYKKLMEDRPPIFELLIDEKTQSMNALKEALTSPPVLVLPKATGYLTLDAGVCTIQVRSAIL